MRHDGWTRARNAERSYATKLRKVARHIQDIINGFDPLADWQQIRIALERYAEIIGPWAGAAGRAMVAEVAARDRKAWFEKSREISRQLHLEIDNFPTGIAMRSAVEEQVGLIKSMPLQAAQRVQTIAMRAMTGGERYEDIAEEIKRTGQVTKSRANLIARTEVGRATTALTASRAQYVGSTHFIWRTMGDSHVRPWHRRLNAQSFSWTDPPECDPGIYALPGSTPNCRCFAEPIIPDEDEG
jgi:SPP1 gp7 family putative phage head morphogenesis protein